MQFSNSVLKGIAEIIVLEVLDDIGPVYGYELMKQITEKSKDVFEFPETTLYPMLYRIEKEGYVKSKKKQAPNGSTRRYYSITPVGKKRLKEGATEMKSLFSGLRHVFRFSR